MKKQKGFADVVFMAVFGTMLFASGYYEGTGKKQLPTFGGEPHYSLRDGCTMKNVAMKDGSGNRADSYEHCKDLPRVYSGREWKEKQS